MTKCLIVVFLLASATMCNAQKQCGCASFPERKDYISCKPIRLKNGAKLYWQFNCDASWLTFQSKSGKRRIIYTIEKDFVDLTEHIGYAYAAEYQSGFLIRNKMISGCCDPAEYLLFNKSTGRLKKNLEYLIYYSDDPKFPVIAYLDDDYDPRKLIFENIDNRKKYSVALPSGRIRNTLHLSINEFAVNLFDATDMKPEKPSIIYYYKTKLSHDKKLQVSLNIDPKRYAALFK